MTEPPGANFRATHPVVTIVIGIKQERVERIRTLLQAYEVDVPSELAALFRDIAGKLPKER